MINNGEYQVLISTIAKHARNLIEVPKVSLMLIEDESNSRQIFARRRLTFEAAARIVEREDPEWESALNALKARHGDLITDLSKMQDFKLFCFKPTAGLFVKGFGQAFEVGVDDLINVVHLDKGHQTA